MPIVVCAGIDVGKAELVVLVLDSRESGASRVFPNDSQGISALIEFLSKTQVARVALEPTSTYHLPVLHALLAQGGYEVYLVDPIQVANFRKLTKTKNKTDSEDAKILAHLVKEHSAVIRAVTSLPDQLQADLRDVLRYRDESQKRRNVLNSWLESKQYTERTITLALIQAELAVLQANIESADQMIAELLPQFPEAHILLSIPGVGPITAAMALASLPREIWTCPKRAAAWAGLVPANRQSGKSLHGSSLSKRGDPRLRSCLYMAALSAIQHNPTIKVFYHHLLEQGKPKRKALLACAHKLLRIMCGILKGYYRSLAPEPAQPA